MSVRLLLDVTEGLFVFTVLAGGVGAARFLDGLSAAVPSRDITAIVNTGDDFERFGLLISPDIDTVVYTLAGTVDPERGYGLTGDTTACLDALGVLGEEGWFRLGDRDLATHLVRTRRLRAGEPLSAITGDIAARLGVQCTILPMTDDPVRTMVLTAEGEIAFQDYFVRRGQQDVVLGLRFAGAAEAKPLQKALAALEHARAIIIAPSNPFVSIGTVLAVAGYRERLVQAKERVAAISPIVGGKAIKGPAEHMMRSLGHEPSALGVARIYRELAGLFVLDEVDAALAPAIEALGMRVLVTDTIMKSAEARERLAAAVLEALP